MNGCQYQQRTFTLPASQGTSQLTWDLAFLSDTEFRSKYGCSKTAYNLLRK